MSTFQEKLRENKNRIKKEKFLSAVDSNFAAFLSNAEASNDLSCIRNAAFPTRDVNSDVQTTTRGKVKNWHNLTFKTWEELVAALARFKQVKSYIGWFFADADGPYFKISVNAFLSHLQSISNYAIANAHYDFGWVGAEDDVGIIIQNDHTSSRANKFEISLWGI